MVAVAGCPADPMTFYFGACAGGVWKTNDANSANPIWKALTDTQAVLTTGDIAIAPSDPNSEEQKGRYRMTVKVPPGVAPGKIMDEIVLKTDHPKATELKIPVDVLIED